MTMQRGLIGLFLLLGVALVLAISPPSTAGLAPPPPRAEAPAGTTPTPTLVATDTPTSIASHTATETATPTASVTGTISPPPCGVLGWDVVNSPNPPQASVSLHSVAAVGPADVWAVGMRDDTASPALIEHWDGTTWQIIPGPASGHGNDVLRAVAASGPNDVWAVGDSGSGQWSLVEQWDGTQWRIIPSPNLGLRANNLNAVTAVGPNDVWVVGSFDDSTWNQTLILHWDGTRWIRYPVAEQVFLLGVAATGPNDIWAVGIGAAAGILHWDGATWSVVPGPIPPETWLYDVVALAPDDVWAVGQQLFICGFRCIQQLPISLHWDGVSWQQVPVPSPVGSRFYAVAAVGPTDVWAVGTAGGGSSSTTMIMHWNGTAWQPSANPNPGAAPRYMHDVAAAGANDVWVVGSYRDADFNQDRTLIEHYTQLPFFSDVPLTAPFYPYTEWLACRNIISGYQCGGSGEPCDPQSRPYFRPGASVTRAQMLKIVVNAAGWPLVTPGVPTFADVPVGNPFSPFIETGASRGIISGYTCGGPGEPCDPANRPYFRWGSDITRGQLSKVVALARSYILPNPPTPTFADVPDTHPFYGFIEAMVAHTIVSGYGCGGVGEPCDPQNRPYFRAANNATRGQVSKFVTIAYGGP